METTNRRRRRSRQQRKSAVSSDEEVLRHIPCYQLDDLRNHDGNEFFQVPPAVGNQLSEDVADEGIAEYSVEAVKAHARELGMDLEQDYEYMWLAEEALLAELEYPWIELYDDASQKTYYYNEQTCESRWDNPVDAHFKDMYCQLKREKLISQPIVASFSKREARLRRELERERSHYKEKKQDWGAKEQKLNRQARKRELALKKERDEWRAKLQALERSLEQDGDEVEKKREEQEKGLAAQSMEISALKQKLDECKARTKGLTMDLHKSTADRVRLEEEYALVLQKFDEYKEHASALEQYKQDVEMLTSTLASKEKEIAALERELAASTDGRAEYERHIDTLKNGLIDNIARTSNGHVTAVQEYERKIARLERERECWTTEKQALAADLEKATALAKESQQVKAMAQKLEQALEQSRLENDITFAKNEDLKAENNDLLLQLRGGGGGDCDGSTVENKQEEEKHRRRCKKLQQAVLGLRKQVATEKNRRALLEQALEDSHAECVTLNEQVLQAETALEGLKKEAYFSNMARKHVEEELITRKLSCSCGFGRVQRHIVGVNDSRAQEECLSDTEDDRSSNCHGFTRQAVLERWKRKASSLSQEVKRLEERNRTSNRHGAFIFRSLVERKL